MVRAAALGSILLLWSEQRAGARGVGPADEHPLMPELTRREKHQAEAAARAAKAAARPFTFDPAHAARVRAAAAAHRRPGDEVTLFLAVKTGPGLKNARYRATARRTWLDVGMKELPEGGMAYRFFVDGPCCGAEADAFGDLVVRHRGPRPPAAVQRPPPGDRGGGGGDDDGISAIDLTGGGESGGGGEDRPASTWLHPSFAALYADPAINYKTQWGGPQVANYGRDWDAALIIWAVRRYAFRFLLSVDDDALVCTQNLVFTLRLLPRPPPMPPPPLAHERAERRMAATTTRQTTMAATTTLQRPPRKLSQRQQRPPAAKGGARGAVAYAAAGSAVSVASKAAALAPGVAGFGGDPPTGDVWPGLSAPYTTAALSPPLRPPLVTVADLAAARARPPPSPGEHAPFAVGWPRWDSFDNCFVLISSDVALFFERHYYSHLRPTHTTDTGATLGAAWSRRHGRWSEVLATHLSPDFVKRMGVLPCDGCGAVEPGHPCHLAPLVDHRPKSSAWTDYLHDPHCDKARHSSHERCPPRAGDCHCWGSHSRLTSPDPRRICVDKLFFDKMKDMTTLEGWWAATWPQNASSSSAPGGVGGGSGGGALAFKPSIAALLGRDHYRAPRGGRSKGGGEGGEKGGSGVRPEENEGNGADRGLSCVPSIVFGSGTERAFGGLRHGDGNESYEAEEETEETEKEDEARGASGVEDGREGGDGDGGSRGDGNRGGGGGALLRVGTRQNRPTAQLALEAANAAKKKAQRKANRATRKELKAPERDEPDATPES